MHVVTGNNIFCRLCLVDVYPVQRVCFKSIVSGAQLSMPLPLVRITSASHHGKSDTDGSVGETSPVHNKTRPLPQQMGKKVPIRPGARKRLGPNQDEMQILPDVVVN